MAPVSRYSTGLGPSFSPPNSSGSASVKDEKSRMTARFRVPSSQVKFTENGRKRLEGVFLAASDVALRRSTLILFMFRILSFCYFLFLLCCAGFFRLVHRLLYATGQLVGTGSQAIATAIPFENLYGSFCTFAFQKLGNGTLISWTSSQEVDIVEFTVLQRKRNQLCTYTLRSHFKILHDYASYRATWLCFLMGMGLFITSDNVIIPSK